MNGLSVLPAHTEIFDDLMRGASPNRRIEFEGLMRDASTLQCRTKPCLMRSASSHSQPSTHGADAPRISTIDHQSAVPIDTSTPPPFCDSHLQLGVPSWV